MVDDYGLHLNTLPCIIQKLDLCRKLYRLLFQLFLLFENYLKLLDKFDNIQSSPQVITEVSRVVKEEYLMLVLG